MENHEIKKWLGKFIYHNEIHFLLSHCIAIGYVVAPLVAPKHVTSWAWLLLFQGDWETSMGVGFERGVGYNTLYIIIVHENA